MIQVDRPVLRPHRPARHRRVAGKHGPRGLTALLVAGLVGVAAAPAAVAAPRANVTASHAGAAAANTGANMSRACPPHAVALGYSDALNKLVYDGTTLGGLSDIAYDARSHSYVSSVDNNATDPSRLWFYRNLSDPHVVRAPLILRQPDGTAYNGVTADNEGLAVLPDGDYLVSSETEPSIRVFGRDGIQKSELAVPARFAVAPAGEATNNKTLEGLTISPDGRTVVAAMEGTLSGDISAAGDGSYRRFLVYERDRRGHYELSKQVGYQVDPGNRISEVQAYARGRLVVMEAAYAPATGNSIELYAVTTLSSAPDVTAVANLSAEPSLVMAKHLVSDVTACPNLGAPAQETQANSLMDNFEGMTIRAVPAAGRGHGQRHGQRHGRGYLARVSLISDDNFSLTQTTRILNLGAWLP